MRTDCLIGLGLIAALLTGCGSEEPRRAHTPPVQTSLQDLSAGPLVRDVLQGINRERKAKGLAPLRARPDLAEVAAAQTGYMVELGRLTHRDARGTDVAARLDRADIVWVTCGENVGRNRGFASPAAAVVDNWMKSPGHRRNILSPDYTHTGIAHAVAPGSGHHYFTQVFVGGR